LKFFGRFGMDFFGRAGFFWPFWESIESLINILILFIDTRK